MAWLHFDQYDECFQQPYGMVIALAKWECVHCVQQMRPFGSVVEQDSFGVWLISVTELSNDLSFGVIVYELFVWGSFNIDHY